MPERDADLVELGQHCRAIYTTDILGDPLHVLWASRFLRAAGSGDPGGERGAAGARPTAGDDRARSKVMGVDAVMVVRTGAEVSEGQVRAWSHKLCSCFGHDRFWIRENDWKSFCLEIVDADDDNLPERMRDLALRLPSRLINVRLWERYYGPGYERGDGAFLISLAEALERIIPGAEVFYGGDSDGVLERFGTAERAALFEHLCEHGHEPYGRFFGGQGPMCPRCAIPTIQGMWSAAGNGYRCACGFNCVESGGALYVSDKEFKPDMTRPLGGAR